MTDENVIMVLRGELCELMVKVNPILYRKYVYEDKKDQSVYGLMRSASLS